VRVIPFFQASGDSAYWNAKVQEDIHVKAQIGRYRNPRLRRRRPLPHISDLAFKRDLSNLRPTADVVNKVNMRTQIGGRSVPSRSTSPCPS